MNTSEAQSETGHNKRQRLNPITEQENTEESVQVTTTKADRSRATTPSLDMQEPSTSQT